MTNLERKMADKKPQDKAVNAVNNATALQKTAEAKEVLGLQGKTLPQATALKERFKAGRIPLQTDFADLIDLANIGRQMVGGVEGQSGPANGFILSSTGRLELKINAAKGIGVDQDGLAIKVGKGMRISNTGLVEPDVSSYSFGSIAEGIEFSPVKVNSSTNGLVVDLHQGLINTASGLSVNVKDGLQLASAGVVVKAGNGVAVNSGGVNVKLAKGSHTNGGGGQGSDGVTTGSAGGLALNSNGLSVDAGDGIQINTRGVSIKLATNSGLSADETNGLQIKPNEGKGIRVDQDGVAVKTGKGIKVDNDGVYLPLGWGVKHGGDGLDVFCKVNGGLQAGSDGTRVIPGNGITVDSGGVGAKAGNGVAVNSGGVNVKLAKGSHTNGGEGQGSDGVTTGSAGGLALNSNGLSVDAGDGIQINTRGVSIKLATNSGLSANETNGLQIVPEQMFQKGMVMMFSGTSVPSGWALCNGSNGTPDLRNKFIRASNGLSSSTGGSNSTSFTPRGTVSVNNHVLTINEIPSHRHGIENYYGNYSAGFRYPALNITGNPLKNQGAGTTQNILSYTGGGAGHNHGASFSGDAGSIKVEPEYFSLAFIMKL
jgi:hypothetical protein